MRNRTPKQEVGHTIEVGDTERDVTLVFNLYKGEKADRWSPGYPPEQELIGATFDDDGSEVPEGLIDEDTIRELGGEAAEKYAEADADAKERAAEARAERRRERREERGD